MLPALYRLTAALLIVHEVDAGYWREWDVLRLPGGVALFLALHVPLALAFLWGAEHVATGGRRARAMALAIAAAGLATLGVHGTLLALGGREFASAPSLVVLALVALSAPALLVAALRAGRRAAAMRA